MKIHLNKLSIIIGLLAASAASSAFGSVDVSGYVNAFAVGSDSVESDDGELLIDNGYSLQTALRLVASSDLSSSLRAEAHYEVRPTFSSVYNDSTSGKFDRAFLQYQGDTFDLTLGRQAVTFGGARYINPTDIFLPYTPQTLNIEYRIGVDAARVQWYPGNGWNIDAGLVEADGRVSSSNSGYFLNVKRSASKADTAITYIEIEQMQMIGASIETSIKDAGIWGEFAYSDWSDASLQKDYTRLSVGADYSPIEDLYIAAEYHYNGAGGCDPNDYVVCGSGAAYDVGGVFLLGENYLILGGSYTKSALNTWSASVFSNLNDQSMLFNIAIEHSLSDNLYLGAGVYLTMGDQPAQISPLVLGSEFGSSPSMLYGNLKYYF